MPSWIRGVVSGAVLGLVVAGAMIAVTTDASAKTAYESAYGFDRTWNAGLRLVRVDLGLKVTEKDDANGYLMFDYSSPEGGNKTVPGSMEFVRNKESNSVKVMVQIPQMPGYHEQVMIDALSRKLRAEYGEPPKKPPAPTPVKDAGPDVDQP